MALTLTRSECCQLDTAIPDVIDLLGDTMRALDLLSGGLETGGIDPDQPAIASALRLFSRALRGAEAVELPALLQLDGKLRAEVARHREAEWQADLCEEM